MSEKLNEEQRRVMEQIMRQQSSKTWKQSLLENIIALGIIPTDQLEMRISRKQHTDIFQLAQTAADAFFTAFNLYPTSLAVHSAVAHLFEASEHVVKAKHRGGEHFIMVYGTGLVCSPLHIAIDDSLDTKTVAVRFAINIDDYQDEVLTALKGVFGV